MSTIIESGRGSSVARRERMPHLYVHDYAGHVSQVEVARALADRGYHVTFAYCDGLCTPRASLADDDLFKAQPISIGQSINKSNYFFRQWQDLLYARALVRNIQATNCDLVLSCNTPLAPQAALLRYCRSNSLPLIHWWSEVYSHAVYDGLHKKSKLLARVVGGLYEKLEKRLIRNSDAVISVCHGAAEIARAWDCRHDVVVIPVASPTDKIGPVAKDNAWALSHRLHDTFNLIYAGTLGIKHCPDYLSRLAQDLSHVENARVIVVSEGPGAQFLASQRKALELSNLLLFPFQPFEQYVNVLGSADIQITILHQEASKYSLPSKFASQLCSGKPQVAVVPADNDAARMISEAGAGLVSPPDDYDAFQRNVLSLIEDTPKRQAMGHQGRRYVENRLSISTLLPRYEGLIHDVLYA